MSPQGDNSLPLVISADAQATHQAVITAMDAAGKLGFAHLRITTVEAAAGTVMGFAERLVQRLVCRATRPCCCCARWSGCTAQWCSVSARRFRAGSRAVYRAPVPVLVVGNITVGGTGKTPLILYLIDHCRARGLRVGVVSRGYGATPPSLPWRVTAEQSAREAGDEPLLLVQRSGVALMIDPDRARAVQALLECGAAGPDPV